MNTILLFIVGICYLGVGVSYLVQGNYGLSLAFIMYAIANYGLWVAGG